MTRFPFACQSNSDPGSQWLFLQSGNIEQNIQAHVFYRQNYQVLTQPFGYFTWPVARMPQQKTHRSNVIRQEDNISVLLTSAVLRVLPVYQLHEDQNEITPAMGLAD